MTSKNDKELLVTRMKELNEKNNEIEKEIENLSCSVSNLIDINLQSTRHLSRMEQELMNYDQKIEKLKKKKENEKGNDENDDMNQKDLEDYNMIHTVLKEKLEEINECLLEPPTINKVDEIVDSTQSLICKAIMLFYIPSNGLDIYLQNFRLNRKTTINEFKKICMSLWNIDQKEIDEYEIKYVDNDFIDSPIKSEEEIDNFNKKNSVKRATFIFKRKATLFESEKLKVMWDKKTENTKTKTSIVNSVSTKFFQKFIGSTSFITTKVEKIEEKLKNGEKQKNQKDIFYINLISIIFYLTFLILTIVSLLNRIPMAEVFQLNHSFLKNLTRSKSLTNNLFLLSSIPDDITLKIGSLFLTDQGTLTNLLRTYGVVSKMRISFHLTKNITPPSYIKISNYTSDEQYYYSTYNSDTAYRNIMTFNQSNLTNCDDCYDPKLVYFLNDTNDFVNWYLASNDTNDINNLDNTIFWYADYVGKGNPGGLAITDSKLLINVQGKLGLYTGDFYNLYISPEHWNKNSFNFLFEFLMQTELFSKSLRSIVISYYLMNFQTKYYYQFLLIYEFDISGYILKPVVKVNVFLPNLYALDNGSVIYACDIIRLIFVSILGLLTLNLITSKLRSANVKLFKKLVITVLQPSVLINLIIIILYLNCFISKMKNLRYNLQESIIYINKQIDVSPELFPYSYYYTLDTIYETSIVFLLLCRILLFFWFVKQIKTFTNYILDSFWKVMVFFIKVFIILLGFIIFANNLWGQYYDTFVDFSSSFQNLLLFSIGHFDSQIFFSIFDDWNITFLLMFYILIVFFIMNSFVGIYLEAYRIIKLNKGNFNVNLEGNDKLKNKPLTTESEPILLKTEL